MATKGPSPVVGEVLEQKKKYELLAEDPTTVPPHWGTFPRSKENKYFASIDWPAWWNEFNQPGAKAGWKYDRLSTFIKSRTSIHWQQILIQHAIGPKPKTQRDQNRVTLNWPYLGDWARRRRNGFYVFDDPVKAQAVQEALEQRKEMREKVSALGPYIARRLAFWETIRGQIVEAYGGRAIRTDKSIKAQEPKTDKFIEWQTKIDERIKELEEQLMKVYGVNPMDPAQNYVQMAGEIGAAAALTGALAAGGHIPGRPILIQDGVELPLPENISYDSMLLAQHLRSHAERFPELPLPEDQKTNGKQKSKAQ